MIKESNNLYKKYSISNIEKRVPRLNISDLDITMKNTQQKKKKRNKSLSYQTLSNKKCKYSKSKDKLNAS